MPLAVYRHARLIVQNAQTPVFEAARAMRTNLIGCVVVTEGRRIVGILTDRDIALRVVAEGRDPQSTSLAEVMSARIVTLPPSAKPEDALRVMRERGIRRVPLVEGHRVVGMVTLDDLLLDRVASMNDVAAIIRAQIVVVGPAQTRPFDEWRWLRRRHARADATRTRLVDEARRKTELRSREDAEAALFIVLLGVLRSLPQNRAATLLAQLPALFKESFRELSPDHDGGITRESIENDIADELDVKRSRAVAIVDGLGRALAHNVPAIDGLERYLPEDLRSVFHSAAINGGRGSARSSTSPARAGRARARSNASRAS